MLNVLTTSAHVAFVLGLPETYNVIRLSETEIGVYGRRGTGDNFIGTPLLVSGTRTEIEHRFGVSLSD